MNFPTDWVQDEELLLEFDRIWSDGGSPEVENFLERRKCEGSSVDFLCELIEIDLEHRWRIGEEVVAEDYLSRFRELVATKETRWSLLSAEISARRIVDKLPTHAELQDRFAGDFDAAQKLFERVAKTGLASRIGNSTFDSESDSLKTVVIDGVDRQNSAGERDDASDVVIRSGEQIGRYRIREKIGAGTFATVWKAEDTTLPRHVAIKILKPERLVDANTDRRMVREAKAAAQLQHPNIVQVFEVGSHRGLPFIVAQLVEGGTLEQSLEKRKQFTETDAARLIAKLARGLHAAHEDGIVHRDIKPANVLLTDEETPLLADFGLAHQNRLGGATLTLAGDILGTPAYMSPEQAEGSVQVVDPRTDIYSLGVLLFQLLTGKLPFEGSMTSVMSKVVNTPAPSPRVYSPTIALDLETISLKCMEKSPADRYRSAAELADDLERFLKREPILARPISLFEKVVRFARRRPQFVTLAAAAALLTCFLLGSLWRLNAINEQKNRAEAAERDMQKLRAETEFSAGRLAMQRGMMGLAVSHFETSRRLNDDEMSKEQMLQLLEALVATRQLGKAEKLMEEAIAANTPHPDGAGDTQFWQAILAQERGDAETSKRLFGEALEAKLSASNRRFALAMHATSTPKAIELLDEAIELNPHSHHARRMVCWLMFTLSDFDSLEKELTVNLQLFPRDLDFKLLRMLMTLCRNNPAGALSELEDCRLASKDHVLWLGCIEFYETYIANAHHHGNDQMGGFDDRQLTTILQEFEIQVLPALKSRGFYLTPTLQMEVEDNLASQYVSHSSDQQDFEALVAFTETHPEPSLLVLLSGQYMGKNDIGNAFRLARIATRYRGFVNDTRMVAQESVFITALVSFLNEERLGTKGDVDYLFAMVGAIESFELYPELIAKYSNQKRGAPVIKGLLKAIEFKKCDASLANRWLDRIERSKTATEADVLWIRLLIAQKSEDWVRVVELGEEMVVAINDGTTNYSMQMINDAMGGAKERIKRLKIGNAKTD